MKKRKTARIVVEESSGNVFADLGLPDAEERLAKADLAIAITREIESRGLTQDEAAEFHGVAQRTSRTCGAGVWRVTRSSGLRV